MKDLCTCHGLVVDAVENANPKSRSLARPAVEPRWGPPFEFRRPSPAASRPSPSAEWAESLARERISACEGPRLATTSMVAGPSALRNSRRCRVATRPAERGERREAPRPPPGARRGRREGTGVGIRRRKRGTSNLGRNRTESTPRDWNQCELPTPPITASSSSLLRSCARPRSSSGAHRRSGNAQALPDLFAGQPVVVAKIDHPC